MNAQRTDGGSWKRWAAETAKAVGAAAGVIALAVLATTHNASERNLRERERARELERLPYETGREYGFSAEESAAILRRAGEERNTPEDVADTCDTGEERCEALGRAEEEHEALLGEYGEQEKPRDRLQRLRESQTEREVLQRALGAGTSLRRRWETMRRLEVTTGRMPVPGNGTDEARTGEPKDERPSEGGAGRQARATGAEGTGRAADGYGGCRDDGRI